MLSIPGQSSDRLCDSPSRRELLRIGGAGLLGLVRLFLSPLPADAARLPAAAFSSFLRLAVGYFVALAWTVPVAVWLGRSPKSSRFVTPLLISLLRPAPGSKYPPCSTDPERRPAGSALSGLRLRVATLPRSIGGAVLSTSARSILPGQAGWHEDLPAGATLSLRRAPTGH